MTMTSPDAHSSESSAPISSLVQQLADALLAKKLIVSTAESCTGGWISQSLTALAGSSQWFDTGFITYSNQAKQKLLEVPASILTFDGPGAVSEESVLAMTAGAIRNSRANVAVAVSGIAGPDGGSEDKPVGTVWIAWQWEGKALARCFLFAGDREQVRRATVEAALTGLVALVA
jgi:nicotinamide-nucleotide amidase